MFSYWFLLYTSQISGLVVQYLGDVNNYFIRVARLRNSSEFYINLWQLLSKFLVYTQLWYRATWHVFNFTDFNLIHDIYCRFVIQGAQSEHYIHRSAPMASKHGREPQNNWLNYKGHKQPNDGIHLSLVGKLEKRCFRYE